MNEQEQQLTATVSELTAAVQSLTGDVRGFVDQVLTYGDLVEATEAMNQARRRGQRRNILALAAITVLLGIGLIQNERIQDVSEAEARTAEQNTEILEYVRSTLDPTGEINKANRARTARFLAGLYNQNRELHGLPPLGVDEVAVELGLVDPGP